MIDFKKLFKKKNLSKNSLKPKFRLGEFLAELIIKSVAFISFAIIILIFVFVFKEALPIFYSSSAKTNPQEVTQSETYGEEPSAVNETIQQGIDKSTSLENSTVDEKATWKNLTQKQWQPVSSEPKFGLYPLFIGSLKVTLISLIIGAPLGILAALFSSFFAPKKLKEIIKPIIELLAGFPSVVIGFFALITLASFCQNLFGYQYRLNAFVGGLSLSLAIIPIIFTVTEDALTAVPNYFTDASLALGATKWQTAIFVVLPAATPGIFAAILLGFGRAFGETMIVLMATGNAALSSFNIFEPVRTLSATIGAEMAEVVFGDTHYNVLFLIGALLFIFTFALNAIAEFYVRNRLMKRFRGGN